MTPYEGPNAPNSMVAKLPANIVAQIVHDREELRTKKAAIDQLPNGFAKTQYLARASQQKRQFQFTLASYKRLGRFFK